MHRIRISNRLGTSPSCIRILVPVDVYKRSSRAAVCNQKITEEIKKEKEKVRDGPLAIQIFLCVCLCSHQVVLAESIDRTDRS